MKEKSKVDETIKNDKDKTSSLTLFNDDVHTFDYVIRALIDVCGHDFVQAEQCTFIVHYKGSCLVRSGKLEDLKPMKEGLIARKLKAIIE
jgi:ATP-dependent Clp protease adaptor protein ClpS